MPEVIYTPTPAADELCRQVGRLWAGSTSLGLDGTFWVFVEPGGEDPAPAHGAIYAGVLPEASRRPRLPGGPGPAAVIRVATSPGAAAGQRTSLVSLGVEAHAEHEGAALAILADLRSILMPSGQGLVSPSLGSGPPGLFGLPELAPGQRAKVWRVIGIYEDAGPAPVTTARPDGLSDDGQAIAAWAVTVEAIGYEAIGP